MRNKKKKSAVISKTARSRSMGKGFSLLEVIMALFVLSVGVVGVLSMIATSIVNSNDARDAVIASQLSQEALEIVRSARDSGNLSGSGSFYYFPVASPSKCAIDVSFDPGTEDLADSCSASPDYKLNFNNSVGGVYSYNHGGTNPSKFSRKVVISDVDANSKNIKSMVYWGSVVPDDTASDCLEVSKCVFSETILSDWADN